MTRERLNMTREGDSGDSKLIPLTDSKRGGGSKRFFVVLWDGWLVASEGSLDGLKPSSPPPETRKMKQGSHRKPRHTSPISPARLPPDRRPKDSECVNISVSRSGTSA